MSEREDGNIYVVVLVLAFLAILEACLLVGAYVEILMMRGG